MRFRGVYKLFLQKKGEPLRSFLYIHLHGGRDKGLANGYEKERKEKRWT